MLEPASEDIRYNFCVFYLLGSLYPIQLFFFVIQKVLTTFVIQFLSKI